MVAAGRSPQVPGAGRASLRFAHATPFGSLISSIQMPPCCTNTRISRLVTMRAGGVASCRADSEAHSDKDWSLDDGAPFPDTTSGRSQTDGAVGTVPTANLWYFNGMRTTIDRAGRLVIPKSLREQSGIVSGEVEISLDGAAIRIESVAAEDLIEEDGLLLLPNGGSQLDADEVRELRLADQR